MSRLRSLVGLALTASLVAFSLLTVLAPASCGSDAVGVDACRSIETARCEAATACGFVAMITMSEALTTAKADAESMAQALGGRLGALVDASSTSSPVFTQPTTFNFDNRFGSQSSAPEVNITVSVTMRYRLIR